MKAIILAAGRGSRLDELTSDKPKCLNKVGESTMLEWQLSALRSGGVDTIIVVTGYKSNRIEEYNVKILKNNRWETTNMVSSLLCASEEFDQPIIVSYSDILYSSEVVSSLCSQEEDAVVVYDLNWRELWEMRFEEPLKDAETFRIDSKGLIQDIGQPASNFRDIQGQYIGLMRFTPHALDWIKKLATKLKYKVDKIDMTTLLRLLIKSGHPICGMAIQGGWCEIDTVDDLKLGNKLYSEGFLKLTL